MPTEDRSVHPDSPVRLALTIDGVVQGVGFRPFVHLLALRHGLGGWVRNDGTGVQVEVEGAPAAVEAFASALVAERPPLATVLRVVRRALAPTGVPGFQIVASERGTTANAPVPADVATCAACLAELRDPTNRRFRHPFITCTDCGPRYTIIEAMPYDRHATTMARFPLCAACAAEYADPSSRRYHAQPICCPACGPVLRWHDPAQPSPVPVDVLAEARERLARGAIVAVKGLGGFHLLCDATSEGAVARLRERKGRGEKPFAVMVRDVTEAGRHAVLDAAELRALEGRERPIVLARRCGDSAIAAAVSPGTPWLGLLLPYTPVHHLLLEEAPPLVCTSGNRSEEPICRTDEEALERLAGVADAFVLHDRPIRWVADDSVVRVVEGRVQPVRRSRGYAPLPLPLPVPCDGILATGGDLKATACLTVGSLAYLGPHIGDMGSLATQEGFAASVEALTTLFGTGVRHLACDRHPGYFGGAWARRMAASLGADVTAVQHHHAHAAALHVEHGLEADARLLALVLDGTGYGDDGAIWGGELLLAGLADATRVAHLAYLPLPGGDAAVRHPARVALAALHAAGVPWDEALPPVAATPPAVRALLAQQLVRGTHVVPTSSAGRLFDALAALVGLRPTVSHEAQAAIEFEALATAARGTRPYALTLVPDAPLLIDPRPLLAAVASDVRAGVAAESIAHGAHVAIADALVSVCVVLGELHGVRRVGLTGGVFQNALLSQLARAGLVAAGFEVLSHHVVPPNDGGLALGQAAVAAARLARTSETG